MASKHWIARRNKSFKRLIGITKAQVDIERRVGLSFNKTFFPLKSSIEQAIRNAKVKTILSKELVNELIKYAKRLRKAQLNYLKAFPKGNSQEQLNHFFPSFKAKEKFLIVKGAIVPFVIFYSAEDYNALNKIEKANTNNGFGWYDPFKKVVVINYQKRGTKNELIKTMSHEARHEKNRNHLIHVKIPNYVNYKNPYDVMKFMQVHTLDELSATVQDGSYMRYWPSPNNNRFERDFEENLEEFADKSLHKSLREKYLKKWDKINKQSLIMINKALKAGMTRSELAVLIINIGRFELLPKRIEEVIKRIKK